MSRELCKYCHSGQDSNLDPCTSCGGSGFEKFTSSKCKGDPMELAEQAVNKVFPMIDENRLRHDALHNHGAKNAYARALRALQDLPFEQATRFIQSKLEACEDKEISIDRQLENLEPLHACI